MSDTPTFNFGAVVGLPCLGNKFHPAIQSLFLLWKWMGKSSADSGGLKERQGGFLLVTDVGNINFLEN